MIEVWSIQNIAAWRVLQRTGVLRTDPAQIDSNFQVAYQWLVTQMHQRIGVAPTGCHFPVWFWYQWRDHRKRKPDLRSRGYLPAGQEGVRLTLALDERTVLLSDFDLWHYVLNGWYLPDSLADSDAFSVEQAAVALDDTQSTALGKANLQSRIEKSWQRIFDLDWFAPDITSPRENKVIQGVVWEIQLAQVRQVDLFKAR